MSQSVFANTVVKNRVQLDLSAEALRELDTLKTKIGAGSRAEVVRYSLRTLQWVLEQVESKARIIVEADGRAQEIVFPFLRVQPAPIKALREFPPEAPEPEVRGFGIAAKK